MATVEKLKNVNAHQKYYTSDGREAVGVTTVLGVLAKPALIHWAWDLGMKQIDYRKYRDKMASIGTLAHHLIECDLKNEPPELDAYSPEEINLAENCLLSYYDWKNKNNPTLIFTEKQLVSDRYCFGGTIDLYAEIDGLLWLVDFKTGKAIYPEMICQLAAYLKLLQEHGHPVNKVKILRIGRDETEGFEEQHKTMTELKPYWKKFKAALDVYNADKEIRRAKG